MAKDNKTAGLKKTDLAKLTKELKSDFEKFKKALVRLTEDLDTLQKGDGTVSYWSGDLAYNWIKTALAHLDHDKVLLDHLDNCIDAIDNIATNFKNL